MPTLTERALAAKAGNPIPDGQTAKRGPAGADDWDGEADDTPQDAAPSPDGQTAKAAPAQPARPAPILARVLNAFGINSTGEGVGHLGAQVQERTAAHVAIQAPPPGEDEHEISPEPAAHPETLPADLRAAIALLQERQRIVSAFPNRITSRQQALSKREAVAALRRISQHCFRIQQGPSAPVFNAEHQAQLHVANHPVAMRARRVQLVADLAAKHREVAAMPEVKAFLKLNAWSLEQ